MRRSLNVSFSGGILSPLRLLEECLLVFFIRQTLFEKFLGFGVILVEIASIFTIEIGPQTVREEQ